MAGKLQRQFLEFSLKYLLSLINFSGYLQFSRMGIRITWGILESFLIRDFEIASLFQIGKEKRKAMKKYKD